MVEPATVLGMPLPALTHKSGGRDRWSRPLARRPEDPTESVWGCLREVLDPEIPISVVDLGLIYGVEVSEIAVRVEMTFTATACPCMDFIREDVSDRLMQESWISSVEIEEVWDPPWTSDRISEAGRGQLRGLGMGV